MPTGLVVNLTVFPARAANEPDANFNTVFPAAAIPAALLSSMTERAVNVERSQAPPFLAIPFANRYHRDSCVLQQAICNVAGILKADDNVPIPITYRLAIGYVYGAVVASDWVRERSRSQPEQTESGT